VRKESFIGSAEAGRAPNRRITSAPSIVASSCRACGSALGAKTVLTESQNCLSILICSDARSGNVAVRRKGGGRSTASALSATSRPGLRGHA
jgi:hypothetical protein